MPDQLPTRTELLAEVAALRQRVAELENRAASPAPDRALPTDRETLTAFIDTTDGNLWSIDTRYRLLVGNDLFHKSIVTMLGRRLQPGESVLDAAFPPAARAEWRGYYDRALSGERFSVEVVVRFTAQPRSFEYHFSPITGSQGQVEGVAIFGRDITDDKAHQAALHEREQKLRQVLTLLPVGVSILDSNRHVVFENSALERILALDQTGLLNGTYHYRRYLAADGMPMPPDGFASVQAMARGQAVYNVETGVVTEHGQTIWVSVSAVPVDFADWRTVIVTMDITDRKRVEQALRERTAQLTASEQQYRELADSVADVFFAVDREMRCSYWNKASQQVTGVSAGDALGKTLPEIFSNAPQSQFAENNCRRALETQESRFFNLEYTFGDTSHAFEVNAYPSLNGVAVLAKDVTGKRQAEQALRESENRFSKAFYSSPVGLLLAKMSDTQTIVDVNDSFCAITGYSRTDLLGRSVNELGVHLTPEIEHYRATLREQGNVFNFEVSFVNRAGQTSWALISTEVVVMNGQPHRIVSLYDITARKHAEEQLQSLSGRIVEVQENERRTLARELHDEIGQALTAVKMNLQATQLAVDPALRAKRLAESIHIVERTLRQTRDLALDLRPSLLDDFGLVAALDWYLRREADRANLPIEFVSTPADLRLPPLLETACYRLVQSAITNVVRHAQASWAIVELHQLDRGKVELIIQDNGVGCDVSVVLAQARRGDSLGLLAMQERVQLANGTIEFNSAPGHGMRVHVLFPIPE